MYISSIHIENFRNFENQEILFKPGINVLIGHNNAGKTNMLKALQLVFDRNFNTRLNIEDFNKTYSDFTVPPEINITATITEYKDELDDKNVIFDWLVKQDEPYEAKLTFSYFFPQGDDLEAYRKEIEKLKLNQKYNTEECFKLLKRKYISKYVSRIYGGEPSRKEKANRDMLEKFDYQFLDAIRDAERQMFFGNNTVLREVLNYFIDYDITQGSKLKNLTDEQKQKLEVREHEFSEMSAKLLSHLIKRVSKNEILQYVTQTGAGKGGNPDFDANITEDEILFALRLIIEKNGFKIPIVNNGLGYNNLLFISLVLAKMQMERSSYMGENAKIFPILAIEEPEAHLHPSMQYKFLKFLSENMNETKQARQIFITTHSTQITSAVNLDSIIIFYEDYKNKYRVGYPGKAFGDAPDGQESKNFVRRFLDSTRSDMLFADRVIFVEGLAEKILLPCFSAYLKKESEILNKHVSTVSVDSRTFKHFLKLFAFKEDINEAQINKKVVCITDADPEKKEREKEGQDKKSWKACFPFELGQKPELYEYKGLSSSASNLIETYNEKYPNIKICTPPEGKGKTLEFELAFNNPTNLLLLSDCFPTRGINKKEKLEELMIQASKEPENIEKLLELSNHEDIKELIKTSKWNAEDKVKGFIASVYYKAVKDVKGEHSFKIENALRRNLELKQEDQVSFKVPSYIEDAITFILEE